jgi:outer membrane protein assembly factor BamB
MTFLLLALAVQDLPEADVLGAASARGGLAVLIGDVDGPLPARLAERGSWIVHALDADAARRTSGRRRAAEAGLEGRVTIEAWDAPVLPYADLLVNLLVAAEPGAVPDAEILRVLAPEGRAWVRRDGRWTAHRKERPADFDEWTHSRHGPDGNMVSRDRAVAAPTGVRWIAGPAQDDGGRKWYYDHILVSAAGRNLYATEEGLVARDAANGLLLWSRPFKAPAVREKGLPLPLDAKPDAKLKVAQRVTRVRPVATGNVLYLAEAGELAEIDARSGAPVAVLGALREPRDILLDRGVLVASDADAVRAWDPATRGLRWTAEVDARRLAASGGALFAVTATEVVKLDLATGKVAWRTPDADAGLALSLTAHDGLLVLEKSTLRDDGAGAGIRVYGADDGALRWARDYVPDMTHYREARAYFARGLLWIQGGKDKILGLDPKSGSERQAWTSRGKHCASPVATERFFMAPECEFTDFETGQRTRSRIFKSACRLPFIPANGLLYTFPVQCECFPMLRGYMALAPGEPPAGLAALPRRAAGPARGEAPAALLRPGAADAEWPTYRHDAWRSGSTPMALAAPARKVAWTARATTPPAGPLAAEWAASPFVRGPLTPPVAAAGRVIVASPERHQVIALDPSDGRVVWTFETDGRVDLPPTIHGGLCLVGGRDGKVYAVRASDGALAWSLRIAPREGRLPAYGQLESPWPVVGSILVDGGLAFAAAGRHPSADGGVRVVAFRPATGEIAWEKAVDSIDDIKQWYGGTIAPKVKIGLDFEPVDCLVRDGDQVAMSRWRFAPADGTMTLAMDSTKYRTPQGLDVPRGLWGYGIRQTKMVRPKPAAAFAASGLKTGLADDAALILVAGATVTGSLSGELRVGEQALRLAAAPVPDGLCAAYGRIYAALRDGSVACIE